jgi:membrane-associated protease RseP (regulator of RpoE activity)
MVRVRYFCIAYAAGVTGLLHALSLVWTDMSGTPGGIVMFMDVMRDVQMSSLLMLVGVLHLAEAALVFTMGGRIATPLYFAGKRGKPIGGFGMNGLWPLPLLLVTTPWEAGWAVIAFPVLIGFSTWTTTMSPVLKARRSAWRLVLYSLTVIGLAFLTASYNPSAVGETSAGSASGVVSAISAVGALLMIGLHELIVWLGRRDERHHRPAFVHDERGLKVLAIVPKSAAAELGIVPGEIVHKVNGQQVRTPAQMHAALRVNPAFVKLEVLNLSGESKFVQRALYANEHHQLGLIWCPDDQVSHVIDAREGGLFSYLRARRRTERISIDAAGVPSTISVSTAREMTGP